MVRFDARDACAQWHPGKRLLLFFLLLIPSLFTQAGVVQHTGTISATETWTTTDVHVVNGDLIIVEGGRLNIDPGAVVKLGSDARITVNGILDAAGTNTSPIVFTALADDSRGGDTSNDGPTPVAAGDWGQIRFNSTAGIAAGESRFEYCELYYGGSTEGALYLDANLAVDHVTVADSGSSGIYVYASTPTISNCTVQNNAVHGLDLHDDTFSYMVSVSDSTFTGNAEFGIHANHRRFSLNLAGNTVTGNGKPLRVNVQSLPDAAAGNNFAGNTHDIFYISNSRDTDYTFPTGFDIFVDFNLTFNSNVTIPAGSVWKFAQNQKIEVYGTLTVNGTATEKVVFTSEKDNSVGGALTDGSVGPRRDDWANISFFAPGSQVDHAILRYGGYDGIANYAPLTVNDTDIYSFTRAASSQSTLNMTRVNIHSCKEGLQLSTGSATLDKVRLFSNGDYGLKLYDSVSLAQTDLEIFGNTTRGLDANGVFTPRTLPGVYWGASNGPMGGGVSGSGDEIQGSNIDASGFATTGTAYSVYSASGLSNKTDGLPQPTFSGASQYTGWGFSTTYIVMQNDTTKTMSATYSGLPAWPYGYQLDVIYFNPNNDGVQSLTDGLGNTIHGDLSLNYAPRRYSFPISSENIDGNGDLTLNFAASSGERVAVSMMTLTQVAPDPSLINPPSAPTLDNYAVAATTGTAPTHTVNSNPLAVTGTREGNSAVLRDGTEIAAAAGTTWSADLALNEGTNALSFTASNVAGSSDAIYVNFLLDSIAPTVETSTPVDGTLTTSLPAQFSVAYTEAGVGLDLNASTLTVNSGAVTGSWNDTGTSLVFTPDAAFGEGTYVLDVTLVDGAGNSSASFSATFVQDSTPPAAPGVNSVSSPITTNSQTITGTKEAGASVSLNGTEIVAANGDTTWSHTASLNEGTNNLSFTQMDTVGFTSTSTDVAIVVDTTPPPAVTFTLNGEDDGRTVHIYFPGYGRPSDFSSYRVYRHSEAFTDISVATFVWSGGWGVTSTADLNRARNTTYYYAVVAFDHLNNHLATVTSLPVTTSDVDPPGRPGSITADPSTNSMTLSWGAASNYDGDLNEYVVTHAGGSVTTPANQRTATISGLNPGTQDTYVVTAVDNDGNASLDRSLSAYTLLANPTNLVGTAGVGSASLTWDAVSPISALSQYRVYYSTANFSTVTNQSYVSSGVNAATVSNLTVGSTYYFAVTALNPDNRALADVTTIAVTPAEDVEPPVVHSISLNGTTLTAGTVITNRGTLSTYITDNNGIARVELLVDGVVQDSRTGSGPYTFTFDPQSFTDAAHNITIQAVDHYGNTGDLTVNITVDLAAPNAPFISSPQRGESFNNPLQFVTGTADIGSTITAQVNGVAQPGSVIVGPTGDYSLAVTLVDGSNTLQTRASNRGGDSPLSNSITVTYDDSVPAAPTGLSASGRSGGRVVLEWRVEDAVSLSGYHVFRSASPFSDKAAATKLTNNLIQSTTYEDDTPGDQLWYYAVEATNVAGTSSPLSANVQIMSDSLGPQLVSIDYTATGSGDPATGLSQGDLTVNLGFDEPLLTTPFFSLSDSAGVAIPVQLTKVDDTTYRGTAAITENHANGTATPNMSARDTVGNRGTSITASTPLVLDTKAPVVSELTVTPAVPIHSPVGTPAQVSATIVLDEAMTAGHEPTLSYTLSNTQTTPVALTLQALTATSYKADFTLPATAGNPAESLAFQFSADDELGNESTKIHGTNFFEVYQDGLPPLETPRNLQAAALDNGRIALSWREVPGTNVYELYRRQTGIGSFTSLARVIDATSYEDALGIDGDYEYTVVSVRQANGQESLSPQSDPVAISSDATAPGAPQNLSLQMASNGIFATWAPPATLNEPVTYRLYRSSSAVITDVSGLSPVVDKIPASQVVDPYPSETDVTYVVTAVDRAGNESAPSNSVINDELRPVSSITIDVQEGMAPNLSWTHASARITSYNLFQGEPANGIQLNEDALITTSFTDESYSSGTKIYTVVGYDDLDIATPARSLTLPQVAVRLDDSASLARGIMNNLSVWVTNQSNAELTGLELMLQVGGKDHRSEKFSLEVGEEREVEIVVGGYNTLAATETYNIVVEYAPNAGEMVRQHHGGTLPVTDDFQSVICRAESFVRGASGQVRLEITNTSPVEIEVVTATSNGNNNSDEIRFQLVDADDNLISSAAFKQALGEGVTTLVSGETVARIQPGATFVSAPFTIDVPNAAPSQVFARVIVDTIHHGLGTVNAVELNGSENRTEVSLVETSYDGVVTSVSPALSYGQEPIVINGRVFNRADDSGLGLAKVNLKISNRGYVRKETVYSDNNGDFTYTFTPNSQDGGTFEVCASHPDLTDTAVQGSFQINRLRIYGDLINLIVPRNYGYDVKTTVQAYAGTNATNLKLEVLAEDQPTGAIPTGLLFDLGEPINLEAGRKARLHYQIAANNDATDGTVVFRLSSDESPNWGTIRINYTLTGIFPSLSVHPTQIETGVANNNTVTETISLENKGLDDLRNMQLTLMNEDNTPAPPWAVLNATAAFGNLAVGDTREVTLTFAPDAAVATSGATPYAFKVVMASDNAPTQEIPVYCWVDTSGVGGLSFKVTDMYTGTTDPDSGQVLQGMAGAKIRLIKEEGSPHEASATTDSLGEVFFADLPAGTYQARVTGTKRNPYQGRVWVRPGVVGAETVHLDADLVTVEWEVNPITLEDRYEIVLDAVFETNVPAAVVVAEPASINIPQMKVGDLYYGEFYLTNYGSIRADQLEPQLIQADEFTLELLYDIPDSIEAGEVVKIPYRVKRHPPRGLAKRGDGEDCLTVNLALLFLYRYYCIGGQVSSGNGGHNIIHVDPDCPSESEILKRIYNIRVSPDWPGGWGTIDFGRGAWPYVQRPKCDDPCPLRNDKNDCCVDEETCSAVGLVSGYYTDDVTDMEVKVLGHQLKVTRHYNNKRWYMGSFMDRELIFSTAADGSVDEMELMGVRFLPAEGRTDLFVSSGSSKIYRNGLGWKWINRNGDWEQYDLTGRFEKWGNPNGIEVDLVYNTAGRLNSIRDHHGEEMIFFDYDAFDRMSAVRDKTNRTVTYTYDANDNLKTVTDVLGGVTTYNYDADDLLISKHLADGMLINVTYDDEGMVSSVLDSSGMGKFFQYSYDGGKNEYYTGVRTSAGELKEYWMSSPFNIIRHTIDGVLVQDKSGVDIEHNEHGDHLHVTESDGTQSTNVFNEAGQVIQSTNNSGLAASREYDENGNLTRLVVNEGQAHGYVANFTYDAFGQQTSETIVANNTGETFTRTMTYDSYGNPETITDPEGYVTSFKYNIMGQRTEVTHPDGRISTAHYDDIGKIQTHDVTGSEQLSFDYNGAGLLSKETLGNGPYYEYSYNEHGMLSRLSHSKGYWRTFDYDLNGNLSSETDVFGFNRTFEFNNRSQLTRFTEGDRTPVDITYHFDIGNRRIVVYPDREITQTFDADGRMIEQKMIFDDGHEEIDTYTFIGQDIMTVQMANGEQVTYASGNSDAGRYTQVTNRTGESKVYTYDALGRMVTYEDEAGTVTQFGYNKNHWLTDVTVDGNTTHYTWAPNGQVKTRTDARGYKTVYDYTHSGQVEKVEYFLDETATVPLETMNMTYDYLDRLTSYSNSEAQTTLVYDDIAHTTTTTVTYANGISKTYVETSDVVGRKTGFTMPDGAAYNYTYRPTGELESFVIPNVGTIQYDDNTVYPLQVFEGRSTSSVQGDLSAVMVQDLPLGVPQNLQISMPNNGSLELTHTHDKLTNITYRKDGNVVYQQDLVLDSADNVEQWNTTDGNFSYDYDDLRQLTSASGPNLTPVSYTYDAGGNRHTTGETWIYGDTHQLLNAAATSFTYDAAGNTQTKTVGGLTTTYIYNHINQLSSVLDDSGSEIASYGYDVMGRRIRKTVAGVTTWFLYNEEGLIAEYDDAGNEIRAYGFHPGSAWNTFPAFLEQNGQYYYYLNNTAGAPVKLVDSQGTVVWTATLHPFGLDVVDPASTITNPMRGSGQYYDGETGLHYNTMRYYDPQHGRYTQRDPFWDIARNNLLNLGGGDRTSLSTANLTQPYNFVYNNPLSYNDPLGLSAGNPHLGLLPVASGASASLMLGGGVEYEEVICCDEFGSLMKIKLSKICVGADAGASVAVSFYGGLNGAKCNESGASGPSVIFGGSAGPFGLHGELGLNNPTDVIRQRYGSVRGFIMSLINPFYGLPNGVIGGGGSVGVNLPVEGNIVFCNAEAVGSETIAECACRPGL